MDLHLVFEEPVVHVPGHRAAVERHPGRGTECSGHVKGGIRQPHALRLGHGPVLSGHGHTAPGRRKCRQHGAIAVLLTRKRLEPPLAVVQAIGSRKISVQIVERPVFRIDHHHVLHLLAQGLRGGAVRCRCCGVRSGGHGTACSQHQAGGSHRSPCHGPGTKNLVCHVPHGACSVEWFEMGPDCGVSMCQMGEHLYPWAPAHFLFSPACQKPALYRGLALRLPASDASFLPCFFHFHFRFSRSQSSPDARCAPGPARRACRFSFWWGYSLRS